MDKLKTLYNKAKHAYDLIPIIALLGMLALVLLQIFSRFILKLPIPWTQEGACILLLCLCAFGNPVTTRRGDHLGAFFLRDKAIGKPLNTVLYIFASIVSFIFLAVMVKGCIQMYTTQSAQMSAVSIEWYQTRWNYIIMAIGCCLTMPYFIRDIVWSVKMLKNKEYVEDSGRSSPKKED